MFRVEGLVCGPNKPVCQSAATTPIGFLAQCRRIAGLEELWEIDKAVQLLTVFDHGLRSLNTWQAFSFHN